MSDQDVERMANMPEMTIEDQCRLLSKKVKQLEDRIDKIQAKVDEQANDEGLWFNHKYITEDYLQCALRELHAVVEGK